MRGPRTALTLLAVLMLAACSGGVDDGPEPPVTTTPGPGRGYVPTEEPVVDWTAELQAVDASVISAVQIGASELFIGTTIVSPGDDAESTELQRAIAVCEAGVALLDDLGYVLVSDSEGANFVVYSTVPLPTNLDLPTDECVKYEPTPGYSP